MMHAPLQSTYVQAIRAYLSYYVEHCQKGFTETFVGFSAFQIIEESFIENKIIEHQIWNDPKSAFSTFDVFAFTPAPEIAHQFLSIEEIVKNWLCISHLNWTGNGDASDISWMTFCVKRLFYLGSGMVSSYEHYVKGNSK
jgi:hypothetical protein